MIKQKRLYGLPRGGTVLSAAMAVLQRFNPRKWYPLSLFIDQNVSAKTKVEGHRMLVIPC